MRVSNITFKMWLNLICISILLKFVNCESQDTSETSALLNTYKSSVSASHDLDQDDRSILRNWTTDFQIELVNVTSQYRLEMTRYKEYNFVWVKGNTKWKKCLEFHQNEISNADRAYFEGENKCLKIANAEESRKIHSVYQMEKEIRKWRKSYRYLLNQCRMNNLGDEGAAGECLVEYMEKDNYYITFQRLILLKLESMSQLYSQITASLSNCKECLKMNLHIYLNGARRVIDGINHCYNIKNV